MDVLSIEQKRAMLDLYSVEISSRLQHFVEDEASSLLELLPSDILDQLKSSPPETFGAQLYFELMNSPLSHKVFDALLIYFGKTDDHLHRVFSFVNIRSRFNIVLKHYEDFMRFLDCDKCISHFQSIEQYSDIVKRVDLILKDNKDDMQRKRIILRIFSPLCLNSVIDILYTILGTSKEADEFVNFVHPNFKRRYDYVNKTRKQNPHGIFTCWPINGDLSSEFLLPDEMQKTSYKLDLRYDNFIYEEEKNLVLWPLDNRFTKETPLRLREYQKELCEDAVSGKNCIICAPTGSGKTVVAAYIIKTHLSSRTTANTSAKVLFLVNNTAIIEQQAKQIEKYVGHRFLVDKICGADAKPLRELIISKDVIVCTPQMIVNELKKNAVGSEFDSTYTTFSLETFSLIFLDECHNTKKESPYSVLMQFYHKNMEARLYKNPPQIVGLSASLGVGGNGKSLDDALKHILKLCAKMDSKTISLVRRNVDELRQFSSPTADEYDFRSDSDDEEKNLYKKCLMESMFALEDEMNRILTSSGVRLEKSHIAAESDESPERHTQYTEITAPPNDKTSEEYLAWVSNHLTRLIPESNLIHNVKQKITEILQQLLIFYRSLELSFAFTTMDSLSYLKEEIQQKTQHLSANILKICTDCLSKLEKHASSKCVLICAVESHLLKMNKNEARSIIFAKTRQGTQILSKLLNERTLLQEANIRSEAISGFNANDSNSRREQNEIIERFSAGTTRVLVSTSVAEEGLDIAQCSLVIKYNYSTNEIAHVQRKGRGRAANSRCILVTNQKSIQNQEERNIMKERLMRDAMQSIECGRIDLETQVETEILELRHQLTYNDKQALEHSARQRESGVDYDLICRKCSTFLCNHRQIKSEGSQFLVCNPDYWENVKVVEFSEEIKKGNLYAGLAQVICKTEECGQVLGKLVRVHEKNMPILAADAFCLRFNQNGVAQIKVVKKWKMIKDNYFTPEPLRKFDLALMADAAPMMAANLTFTGT